MPRLIGKVVPFSSRLPSQSRRCVGNAQANALRTATLAALRSDPRLLKVPPYLSLLCIVVGIVSLLILPLDEYSRRTYISENALLPGQVHTYFGGSDQNVFRAYKHEVDTLAIQSNAEYVPPPPHEYAFSAW